MIKVENLHKKFGKKIILEDLSVEIPKGKITSLIGANGSGKSTLLSIISRLLEKDEGKIYLQDQELSSFKNKILAQKISILKQTNQMDLKLTIEELVAFGRFPYSQGRLTEIDKEKINQALDFCSLTDIKDTYLDELSGGQRQRAFLAMVIAQDTDYILLDEPLNNLDMKLSVQIMKTLQRLVTELNKTVIIVIHEINFASIYSDYIIALKDKKVAHFGKTENIITPEILKDIFDLEFEIIEKDGKKFCNYFKV